VTTTAEVTGWVRSPPVADLFYATDPDRLRDDVVRHDQDGDRHGPSPRPGCEHGPLEQGVARQVKGGAAEDHRRGTGGNVAAGVGNRELVGDGRAERPRAPGSSEAAITSLASRAPLSK
jgi:hypothetical protein